MFSCGAKKSNARVRRDQARGSPVPDFPVTPARASFNDTAVPNRPSSGTPAPWAPRLSVLARVPQVNRSGKGDDADLTKPVFVGEFPQVVRDEQNILLHKRIPVEDRACGGIDKSTSLAWIICGNRVYLWSYLSPASSMKCVILEIPPNEADVSRNDAGSWILRVVNCDVASVGRNEVAKQCNSAAVVLCNCQTRAVIYWPDIYSQPLAPVNSLASSSELGAVFTPDGKASFNRQRRQSKLASGLSGLFMFNSMIASTVPNRKFACVALACSSSGELWQFQCTPTGIHRRKVFENITHFHPQRGESVQTVSNVGYPRSLTWGFPHYSTREANRQFLVLTDHEIQCFRVEFDSDIPVSKLWSQEIVGTDAEVGIKKDLAGQKRIWPLDMQVDDHGKVITILVATFCNDRISSSSYMQYSLLTMQYKSVLGSETTNDKVLEKKAPIEVIIPKARVEDEDSLFSMRLRIGGNPSGSTVIISGDGTATVSHYYRNSTRLYKFDLPYDAGKVLDASILPSADDYEEGAWVVLTEKAGIWAIPEKAVILGGVEPPERSLSRKGSSNERSAQEEIRNLTFAGNVAPRRVSSEAWSAGDKQRTVLSGIGRRTAQDEESEALLNNLFNEFLSSGQIDRSLEKLETSGSFERDGETNVFVRMSKSIIDTLAKHWTTTRGAEILAMAVVSTQLLEKKQKHEKFLHFLALSKCHEELCSKQRHALQIILEHGEKLSAMIQLRELQNMISQNRSTNVDSSKSSSDIQMSGALWDMIQLVGERARRNTVLLMDRDNAEVFYSKVSDLEDLFYCLDKELEYVIRPEHPLAIQIQRACELSTACVTIIRTCFNYKNENRLWYPPPEGLTPWYCQPIVRTGIWSVASVLLHLLNETSGLDKTTKLDLYNNLEALAEVLLEAYSGAVTAKNECGEEHRGLLNEYWERRDTLLESLYQKVKEFEDAQKDSFEVAGEHNDETIMKLTSQLLSIAKRHGCYKVMWTVCCDVNDSELLRNIMHESLGPNGGFSYYVFKRLHESRQFSQLLRLGEEFPEELSIFLREYQDLQWLHDLFLHQFSSASESLHTLAFHHNINPKHYHQHSDPRRTFPSPKLHMASRTENRPPRSLSNKKGGAEEAFSDKRRRTGTERTERQGGRGRAPLGALKADANEVASVEGSECSVVEFTKEKVEALLNEKTNTKENRYDNKRKTEQMGDLIKRLKLCVRWCMKVEEGHVQEKEKLQTDLESAEKKLLDTENKMEIKIAELDETISNLKAIISSLEERIVREESDKMEAIASYKKEQEARSAAEQMQASVSTELEKVREEKSAAERKVISNEDLLKRAQEYNMSLQQFNTRLQSDVETSNEAIKRVEMEKATIVETLSNVRGHNKALQDQLASFRVSLDEVTKQKEMLVNELKCVREELKQTRDDRDRLQLQVQTLAAKVEKYGESTAKSCAQLDTLTIKTNALEETCSSQRDQIYMLQQQLIAEKEKLKMADLSASETRTVFEDQRRIVGELQERLAEKEFQVIEGEKLRKKLHNTILELKGNIRVFCRVRPLLPDDGPGTDMVLSYPMSTEALGRGIELVQSGQKYPFTFDKVFNHEASQQDVFVEISQLVQSALDGYKVCIFAYGQTGSGKTYTMMGRPDAPDLKGLIPRSLEQIFQISQSLRDQGWNYKMQVSVLEIYNETIRDLLSSNRSSGFDSTRTENGVSVSGKQPYTIKHDVNGNTHVSDLTIVDVCSANEISSLLQQAAQSRSVGRTHMNEQSSRSHFVFTLRICGFNENTEQQVQGVLNLIDLAGSERLSRSGATGDRLKETQAINKSLSSLSDVIFALAKKEEHVPFRNSKLTYLLQPCLGGDSKTLMFVNISPDPSSTGESLCSLRFAARVNACEIGIPRRQTSARPLDSRLSSC